MTFRVILLRRAQSDLRRIAKWLADRSPKGAHSWLEAFDELYVTLGEDARRFPRSSDSAMHPFEVREARFKTRRGRIYRVLFTIVGDQVRIFRIRGPGQPPLAPDEVS